MSETHYYDQSFQSVNFEGNPGLEFEECRFSGCDFSAAGLKEVKFISCTFDHCNWSNVDVFKTSFQDCAFTSCKMIGIGFHECNAFNLAASFEYCNLTHSSFAEMNLTRFSFKGCEMEGCDFGYADLSGVQLTTCHLADAIFESTNLTKADLRGSTGFHIDPETNPIKSARFSKEQIAGLLMKYGIEID